MPIKDYPIYSYPTGSVTDPAHMLSAMGSFWNVIFQEQGTLKGYTTGQAEEMGQRYLELIDVIKRFSTKDLPLLRRQKWHPVVLRKSQVVKVKAESNTYRYTSPLPAEPKDFGIMASGLVNPALILTKNINVVVKKGLLYFYQDLFSDTRLAKAYVTDANGANVYYTDEFGAKVKDEQLVIWAYQADIDASDLSYAFGYLFSLIVPSEEFYRQIIRWLISLYTSGPTVNGVLAIAAAFTGNETIRNSIETVEEVFHDTIRNVWVVVTDSNAYRFSDYYTPLATVVPGKVLYAGSVFNNSAAYHDSVTSGDWWRTALTYQDGSLMDPVGFTSHLFLGNYKRSLVFANSYQDIILNEEDGNIVFPVMGDPEDVKQFNLNLNDRTIVVDGVEVDVKDTLLSTLGLTKAKPTVLINPVDFLFTYYFKYNAAFVRLNFKEAAQYQLFTSLLKELHKVMPGHVYFMFYFDWTMPEEEAVLFGTNPSDAYTVYDKFYIGWDYPEAEPEVKEFYELSVERVDDKYELQINTTNTEVTSYGFRMLADDNTTHTVDCHYDYGLSAPRMYTDANGIWVALPSPGSYTVNPDGNGSLAKGVPYTYLDFLCASDGTVHRLTLKKDDLNLTRKYTLNLDQDNLATVPADGTEPATGKLLAAQDYESFTPGMDHETMPLVFDAFDVKNNFFAITRHIPVSHDGVTDMTQEIHCTGTGITSDSKAAIMDGDVSTEIPTYPKPSIRDIPTLQLFSFVPHPMPMITWTPTWVPATDNTPEQVQFDYLISADVFRTLPRFSVADRLELQAWDKRMNIEKFWPIQVWYDADFTQEGTFAVEAAYWHKFRLAYFSTNGEAYYTTDITFNTSLCPVPLASDWQIVGTGTNPTAYTVEVLANPADANRYDIMFVSNGAIRHNIHTQYTDPYILGDYAPGSDSLRIRWLSGINLAYIYPSDWSEPVLLPEPTPTP